MLKFILLSILVCCCVDAQFDSIYCPQMTPMSLFDMDRFTGVWYGIQSVNSIPACTIFKITHGAEPFTYALSTETRLSTGDHKYRTKHVETLTVKDLDYLAKMDVIPLPRVLDFLPYPVSHMIQSNFTVANTDYESYAVVYRSFGLIHYSIATEETEESCTNYAQIWSRTPALTEKFIQKVKSIIDEHPMDSLLYNLDDSRNKTGCFFSSTNIEF